MSLIQIIKPTNVFNSLIKKVSNEINQLVYIHICQFSSSSTVFTSGRCYLMWLLLNFLSNPTPNKDQSLIQQECDVICHLITSLYNDTEVCNIIIYILGSHKMIDSGQVYLPYT